jgi:hypothetical protein
VPVTRSIDGLPRAARSGAGSRLKTIDLILLTVKTKKINFKFN